MFSSFSRFNPAPTEGGYRSKRQAVFLKWLQCNATHLKTTKKFDSKHWRTAKPWLSYNEVYKAWKEYKRITLGSINLGTVTLTDEEVERAVKFEQKTRTKRDINTSIIMNIIDDIYEEGNTFISANVVFREISNELVRLGYPGLNIGTQAWLELRENVIKNSNGDFKIKRKLKHYHIVAAIAKIMKPNSKDIDKDILREEVAFYLDQKGRGALNKKMFNKAVQITGTRLQRRYTDIMPEVLKLFIHIPSVKPIDKHEVATLTNFILDTPIPLDAYVWDDIDTHLVRRCKGTLNLSMYTADATTGEYVTIDTLIQTHKKLHKSSTDVATACVKEQLLDTFGTTEPTLRKKTEIDWEHIKTTYMKRGFTLTPQKDLQRLCDIIKQQYGVQMIPQDPIFDFIKSQGLICA